MRTLARVGLATMVRRKDCATRLKKPLKPPPSPTQPSRAFCFSKLIRTLCPTAHHAYAPRSTTADYRLAAEIVFRVTIADIRAAVGFIFWPHVD